MSNLLICRVCYCVFESQSEYATHYNSNHLPQQSINTDQDQSILQSSDQSGLPDTNQPIPNVNHSTAATQSLLFTIKSEPIDEQNENESFTSPFEFVPSETVTNPSESPQPTIDTDDEPQSTNHLSIDSSPSTSNIELSVPDNGTELRCSHCDRSFTKPHFLRMHLRYNRTCSEKNSAEYSKKQCRFCGKLFSESSARHRHEQNMHVNADSYRFVCSAGCGARFKAAFNLKVHQQSKTACEKRQNLLKAATKPSQQSNTSKKQNLSPSANLPTKRKYADSLIESEGDDEPLINIQNELKRARIDSSSSSRPSFFCQRCGAVFSSRNGLGRHAKRANACQAYIARMEQAKPFGCRKGCGARFRHRSSRDRHEHSVNACPVWQKSKYHQGTMSQPDHQQTANLPPVTTKHEPTTDVKSERLLCAKGCGASFASANSRSTHYRLLRCRSKDEPSTSTSISNQQSINNSLSADYRCVDCGRRLKDAERLIKHRSQCLKRALNESMKISQNSDSSTQDRPDEVFCLISNQTALKAATHCFHADHLKAVKPTETALGAEDGYMTDSNIQPHENSVEQPVNQDIPEKATESSTSATNNEIEESENSNFESPDVQEWNLFNLV